MSMEAQAADSRSLMGASGEQYVAEQIVAQFGWAVAARNWRCPDGEIDLVALEPVLSGPPTAVIIEVKTRSGTGFGHPLEAITPEKVARLYRLAKQWSDSTDIPHRGWRVDGAAVIKRPGMAPQLTYARGLR